MVSQCRIMLLVGSFAVIGLIGKSHAVTHYASQSRIGFGVAFSDRGVLTGLIRYKVSSIDFGRQTSIQLRLGGKGSSLSLQVDDGRAIGGYACQCGIRFITIRGDQCILIVVADTLRGLIGIIRGLVYLTSQTIQCRLRIGLGRACQIQSRARFLLCGVRFLVNGDHTQFGALQVGIHTGDVVAQQGIAAFRIHAVLRDLVLVVVQESGFAVQVGFDAVTPWMSVKHRRSHCGGGSQRKRNYQSSSFHVKPHHLVVYRFCLC